MAQNLEQILDNLLSFFQSGQIGFLQSIEFRPKQSTIFQGNGMAMVVFLQQWNGNGLWQFSPSPSMVGRGEHPWLKYTKLDLFFAKCPCHGGFEETLFLCPHFHFSWGSGRPFSWGVTFFRNWDTFGIHKNNTFCKKNWVKTVTPAFSSGQSNLHPQIWITEIILLGN